MKSGASVNIHASCVRIGRAGVLLLGASGSGKSDLALRLIEGGARLIADDRAELFVKNARLWARAPTRLAGLIEIRGLGIVRFPHGCDASVALAVRLGGEAPRLPESQLYAPPHPLRPAICPPLIALDAFAPSAPVRIAAALAAFSKGLFRDTFDTR